MLKSFVKIFAAIAFMAAVPAAAQVQSVDPDQPESWEAPASTDTPAPDMPAPALAPEWSSTEAPTPAP
ncbi:MAG TPA: hypothetical protein VGO55_02540, partial [Allosphingosinicella sp.]|nr:hypothetical protein [Allosphingosinicella sp.]